MKTLALFVAWAAVVRAGEELAIGREAAAEKQRLPDAIIYGVRKGGTRALLEFLRINSQEMLHKIFTRTGSLRIFFKMLKINFIGQKSKIVYLEVAFPFSVLDLGKGRYVCRQAKC